MHYTIIIDKSKISSLEGILPSLSCFGRISSISNKELEWHIDDSIIYIDCALEHLKRILPEDSVLDIKKERKKEFIPIKKNTRKKSGSHTRNKRK